MNKFGLLGEMLEKRRAKQEPTPTPEPVRQGVDGIRKLTEKLEEIDKRDKK